uniref:Uncharacterized protein n=1 Tax=Arundo donax TaxID=35708 RepID=A0A0A9G0H7_ARUDO
MGCFSSASSSPSSPPLRGIAAGSAF